MGGGILTKDRKRILLVAWFLIFHGAGCVGQVISCAEAVGSFYVTVTAYPHLKFEVPPWVVGGCWRGYYAIEGTNTVFISTPNNLIDGSAGGSCDVSPVKNPSESDFMFLTHGARMYAVMARRDVMHMSHYAGIFSAHAITMGDKAKIVSFVHGENKGPENSMMPGVSDPWDSYFSFVNLAWVDNTLDNSWGWQSYHDEGPVLWPSAGYTNPSGTAKTSQGIRHPSSIIHDNYLYIFYKEENLPSVWGIGKDPGVKLARVALGDVLHPSAYEVFFDGSWIPSLPYGLNKTNIHQYRGVPGAPSSVVTGGYETHRFSVAKVRNTDYFLGVEEYAIGNQVIIALRKSYDLVNWGPRYEVWRDYGGWESGRVHYPIFLDKDGWTNTEIDEDRFFILGSFSNIPDWGRLSRLSLTLKCAEARQVAPQARMVNGVDETVSLFPNPFSDRIFVTWPDHYPVSEISLYDAVGRTLLRSVISPGVNEVLLDKNPSGVISYVIRGGPKPVSGRVVGVR